jgi:hypothetical protein
VRKSLSQSTVLGTVAGIAGFIGVLPLLVTLGIAQQLPLLGALSLTVIHVCLMTTGAWLFTIVFSD